MSEDKAKTGEASVKEKAGMPSLEDYNKAMREHFGDVQHSENKPRPNGIACPECGTELLDSHPMMQLASNPPQKNVNCPKCEYAGYRVDGPAAAAGVGLAVHLHVGELPPLEPEAQVIGKYPLGVQVCVPDNWTDDQVTEFANLEVLCGVSTGWLIRKEGHRLLAGDPERAPCGGHGGGPGREGFVHIMLDVLT